MIYLWDKVDVEDALGYHERNHRGIPFGFVWQGARYEGLVTVFLEHLGAFGGAILDVRVRDNQRVAAGDVLVRIEIGRAHV